jgi:hypothetical protein
MRNTLPRNASKRARGSMLKFPSTPHLANLGTLPIRGDKVFTDGEREEFLSHEITVEEKVDGANLGVSFDDQGAIQLRNRGNGVSYPYHGQWKKIPDWLKTHEDRLFDSLGTDYLLFGEWCYARHSIEYTRLPGWFIGFDIYDLTAKKFLAASSRNKILKKAGIPIVKELGRGQYSLDELVGLMQQSAYTEALCEGLYLRWENGEYVEKRAKLVRPEFVQSIGSHWSRKPLQPNKVLYSWA